MIPAPVRVKLYRALAPLLEQLDLDMRQIQPWHNLCVSPGLDLANARIGRDSMVEISAWFPLASVFDWYICVACSWWPSLLNDESMNWPHSSPLCLLGRPARNTQDSFMETRQEVYRMVLVVNTLD